MYQDIYLYNIDTKVIPLILKAGHHNSYRDCSKFRTVHIRRIPAYPNNALPYNKLIIAHYNIIPIMSSAQLLILLGTYMYMYIIIILYLFLESSLRFSHPPLVHCLSLLSLPLLPLSLDVPRPRRPLALSRQSLLLCHPSNHSS